MRENRKGLGTKCIFQGHTLMTHFFHLRSYLKKFPPSPNSPLNHESINGLIHDEVTAFFMIQSLHKIPTSEHCCTGDKAFAI
jgi:hypothetical protein